MVPSLPNGLRNSLLWCEASGRGWCGAELVPYDKAYFDKYLVMDESECGVNLTRARLDMVRRHYGGKGVDIGIGGGKFVEESGWMGFDVNADAVSWLWSNGLYCNPYANRVKAVTCWDSLEHIPEPEKLLAQIDEWLFVSMPIYKDYRDCLFSKHYRPGEHIHYFTFNGLVRFCESQGFALVEDNTIESDLGRENIHSFAFRRVSR